MKEKMTGRAPRAEISPELVKQARAGDQAAFAELYEQTSAGLYRSVRSMVRDEDLAWDILQEAYLQAWHNLGKLQADEAFLAWLRRIAVTMTAKKLKERQPLTFTDLADEEGELPELPDLSADTQPELALDRKETARLVREILAGLPEQQQLILGMRYYEDMPVREIADLLGIAPGTVRAQLCFGRKKVEAGVRALEQQGVKLYGLGPLPFLLALLRQLEPAAGAEKQVLRAVLADAPAAAGSSAVSVTALTAGQVLLKNIGVALLAVAAAAAVIVGGKLAYDALKRNNDPPVGPERPTVTAPVDPAETSEPPETAAPTEYVTLSDTAESLEPAPSELPGEPTVLASGRFGLRQREEQTDPNVVLPYFTVIDPDADDRIYTNNAVEIRYDGSGVWRRALPDGEERLLFPLERTDENNYYLFGVTENRLYFNCHNPDPDDWWGLTVFSVDHQGADRQELGSNWDPFFGNGWVVLRSFASDVRPTSARIFNRNDELVAEEPKERVWAVEAVDGALYIICVKEQPKEGEDSEWSEHLIRIDPDGTQTVLTQIPTPSDHGDYGVEANIYNGVIWVGAPSGKLYDLYTLEPLEDRFDSSFYDDSLTWTLDSSGVLTVSGSGLMGRCWFQPWEAYRETITAVVLEDGVTNVGDYAFAACTSLRSVSIPDSVTAIGESAFSQCALLARVTVPDSVTHLGRGVFSGCETLSEVRLPAGLTEIGDNLFSGCESLASLTIPDTVTAIGDHAFIRCGSLAGIALPAGVTRVGERAFCNCRALTGITVPAGVTSIGDQAFGWYYDLSSGEEHRREDFTIYGAEGSAAQAYAEENGFQFVEVN